MDDNTYKIVAPFKPLEWQKKAIADLSPVVLFTGSAGGGKSICAYNKVHRYNLQYPGTTTLLLRKHKEDAKRSCVQMMSDSVIGDDPSVVYNVTDAVFRYKNGSRCYIGGMKDRSQREAIRSIGGKGGVGMAVMEEAIEFDEEDFDELNGRMRDPTAPWTQIVLMTNPDKPLHWINTRLIIGGEASIYFSSASDNPHNPPDYKDRLAMMRGLQGSRLRDGLWIIGTGLVLDQWLDDYTENKECMGNVRIEADYLPGYGTVAIGADDGYSGELDKSTNTFTPTSHPRVFLLAQLRSDGIVAVFAEHYAIKTLQLKHIEAVKDMCRENDWPIPASGAYDKAAATLGGALKTAGIRPYKGPSDVKESLKLLNQEYIAPDENGVRRVIVHPRCRLLRLEMNSYSRDKDGNIIKENDHGPDALRYLVHVYNKGKLSDPDIGVPVDGIDMDEISRKVEEVYKKHGLA